MKRAFMQIVIVVVCLFVVPAMWAQVSETANQIPSSAAPSDFSAVVPMLIEFTGTLLDRLDRPMAGPVGVTFALYAEQSGGAALWMETQNVHPDAKGTYTVLLGAASRGGLPAEQFASGKARWLGLQVENQGERPRIMLVSVPYALKAGDAETLGGLPPSAFLTGAAQGAASGSVPSPDRSASNVPAPLAAGPTKNSQPSGNAVRGAAAPPAACPAIAGEGVANFFTAWSAHCTIAPSPMAEACSTNGCNVGIGTQTPQAGMDVEAPLSTTTGVQGVTRNSAFFAAGVFGHATAATGLTRGVYGASDSPSGIGVHGIGAIGGQFESGNGLILKGRGFGGDQFTLDAAGNMRLSGGISAGGSGLIQIDAPGLAGGRFTVLPNGNVGVNKANPAVTLDVGGSVNISGAVNTGSVKINGDVPMNSNPRMFFNGFFPGTIGQGQTGASIVPDRDIIVTRMNLVEGVVPNNCTNFGTISLVGVNNAHVDVPLAGFVNPESGPVSVTFLAGDSIDLEVSAGESGCGTFHTTAGNVWVSVQYLMK